MNIPKEFKVGVRKHTVKLVPKIDRGKVNGRIWLNANTIHIARKNHEGLRKPRQMEQTFWHEAVHAILGDMGHHLSRDEDFVDAVATRIHQITTTAKF